MKMSLRFTVFPLAALVLGFTGCDDGYSDRVVYEVRTDPLRTAASRTIEPELPDRPGQLPLMKMSDVDNPANPFFKYNKDKSFLDFKDSDDLFRDPMMVSDENRDTIKDNLDELFGTPAIPTVGSPDYADLTKEQRNLLKLSPEVLAKGSKLYRIQCLHCHGVTGDGRGPTGRWVNPHPRDYRQGRFKFQSVDIAKAKTPSRNDLMRTLEIGIEGTAMPSFSLMPTEDREALVSYVIHLSLRGKTEYDLFKGSFKYKEKVLVYYDPGQDSIRKSIKSWFLSNLKEWVVAQADESQIQIGDYPAELNERTKFEQSVQRGMQLFTEPPAKFKITTSCVSCHIEFGRRSTFRLDAWGTLSKPANLTQGVYRGGRRPIDIYRRIHSGIDPSGMLQFKDFFGDATDPVVRKRVDEYTKTNGCNPIWDLVNFVQVLGNPTMRREMKINID